MGFAINAKLAGSVGSACCCTLVDCCLYNSQLVHDGVLAPEDLESQVVLYGVVADRYVTTYGPVMAVVPGWSPDPVSVGIYLTEDPGIPGSYYWQVTVDESDFITADNCLSNLADDLFPDVYNLSGYTYSSTITRVSTCRWEFDNGQFGTEDYRYIAVYWDKGVNDGYPIGSGWTMEVRFGNIPDPPYYYVNFAYSPGPQASPANTYTNDPVFTITVTP